MGAHMREQRRKRYGALMSEKKISYIELPSTDVARLKKFYGQVFGWTFQDYGDDYAALENAGMDGGFNGDASRSETPLVMMETPDIRTMITRVEQAGGTITVPTFQYPGAQRFHFRDPDGNELAVFQPGA